MRGVLALVAGLAITAQADRAAANPTRDAYDLAMKCFVANGHLSESFEEAGDMANARLFDARSKKSFDAANGLAVALYLQPEQVRRDFDAATDRELRKLLADPSYVGVIATECKRVGLM